MALRPDLIAAHVPPGQVLAERRRVWVLPAASALTLALAFVVPGWNNLAMLTLLVARWHPRFRAQP